MMNTYAGRRAETERQSVAGSLAGTPTGRHGIYYQDNRPGAVVQRKQAEAMTNRHTAIIQRNEHETGLPYQLKSGIESLSGYSMNNVKVYYNSAKPAQLDAYAYAQGTDIHIAPGQEKHLPHEAWHVVQQKQGRVKPTMQMKGKVNINDDKALEKEADIMGSKAFQMVKMKPGLNNKGNQPIAQLFAKETDFNNMLPCVQLLNEGAPIQRTRISVDGIEIPGTANEDSDVFWAVFALSTMADSREEKIAYARSLVNEFEALENKSEWDIQMIRELRESIDNMESQIADEDGGIQDNSSGSEENGGEHDESNSVNNSVEEDGGLEAYSQRQAEGNAIVIPAIESAIGKINAALAGAGPFAANLATIRNFLVTKLAEQENENHFIFSFQKDGEANELAHSKPNGDIELFKGFFEAGSLRRSELLIHEAAHSSLGLPTDYAYMWQPVFRFLPQATQLRNPDSYVAAVLTGNGEAVNTPTTLNDVNDMIFGLIDHVCMRGTEIMKICLTQLGNFDAETPQPLLTLKTFRNTDSKIALTALINMSIAVAPAISSLIIGGRVVIRNADPVPVKLSDATCTFADNVYTVDFINPPNSPPFVLILAKLLVTCAGVTPVNGLAIARTLNYMASAGHMSTEDLTPRQIQ